MTHKNTEKENNDETKAIFTGDRCRTASGLHGGLDLTDKYVVSVSGSAAVETGAGIYEAEDTVTVDAGSIPVTFPYMRFTPIYTVRFDTIS